MAELDPRLMAGLLGMRMQGMLGGGGDEDTSLQAMAPRIAQSLAASEQSRRNSADTRDLTRLAMGFGFLSGRPDALNVGGSQGIDQYNKMEDAQQAREVQGAKFIEQAQLNEIRKQQAIANEMKNRELAQHRLALEEEKKAAREQLASDKADQRDLTRELGQGRLASEEAARQQRSTDSRWQTQQSIESRNAIAGMQAAVAQAGLADHRFQTAMTALKDAQMGYQRYLAIDEPLVLGPDNLPVATPKKSQTEWEKENYPGGEPDIARTIAAQYGARVGVQAPTPAAKNPVSTQTESPEGHTTPSGATWKRVK